MRENVAVGTGGFMVKGNNHSVVRNLAVNSVVKVYDKFPAFRIFSFADSLFPCYTQKMMMNL